MTHRFGSKVIAVIAVCAWIPMAQVDVAHHKTFEMKQKEAKLGQYYETIISKALEEYFDKKTFMVDAKATLVEKLVPTDPSAERMTHLPGLPKLPEDLRREPEILSEEQIVSRFTKDYEISAVTVNLLVDTSYTFKHIEFLLESVRMTANLSSERGDVINVKKVIFPSETGLRRFFSLPKQTKPIDDVVASDSGRAQLEARRGLSDWYLVIAIIALVFVLVVVVIVLVILALGKRKNDDSDKGWIERLISEVKALKEEPKPEPKEATGDRELQRLRSSAIYRCIGDPRQAAKVITSWFDADPEEGAARTARLVVAVDRKLFDVVKPELGTKQQEVVSTLMSTIDSVDNSDAREVIEQFRNDWHKLQSQEEGQGSDMDLFQFVRQLNSSQVLHLVKGESEGIQALVLAQLKPELAALILQKFDPAIRQQLLVSMGNISNISVAQFKNIAARLSSKALDIVNMKHVEVDGIDNILAIIPELPVTEQDRYMSEIAEKDLNLANKVRRYFVGFNEVHTLPAKFLQVVLEDFDRDVLAIALINAPEQLYTTIMQLFPERMQLMIQSTMQSRLESSSEEIEQARGKLVRHVMKKLQHAGGRPS